MDKKIAEEVLITARFYSDSGENRTPFAVFGRDLVLSDLPTISDRVELLKRTMEKLYLVLQHRIGVKEFETIRFERGENL